MYLGTFEVAQRYLVATKWGIRTEGELAVVRELSLLLGILTLQLVFGCLETAFERVHYSYFRPPSQSDIGVTLALSIPVHSPDMVVLMCCWVTWWGGRLEVIGGSAKWKTRP